MEASSRVPIFCIRRTAVPSGKDEKFGAQDKDKKCSRIVESSIIYRSQSTFANTASAKDWLVNERCNRRLIDLKVKHFMAELNLMRHIYVRFQTTRQGLQFFLIYHVTNCIQAYHFSCGIQWPFYPSVLKRGSCISVR